MVIRKGIIRYFPWTLDISAVADWILDIQIDFFECPEYNVTHLGGICTITQSFQERTNNVLTGKMIRTLN